MTRITTIDATACRTFREICIDDVNKALAPYGLVASVEGTMNYNRGGTMTAKLSMSVVGEGQTTDEAKQAVAKQQWDSICMLLNRQLKPEHFGATIHIKRVPFRIAGHAGGRSSKVAVQRVNDGRLFNYDADATVNALRLAGVIKAPEAATATA